MRLAIIPLGRRLPVVSSSLPESRSEPDRLCSLFGLASGGVYQAKQVTLPAGALLPHHFTLTGKAKAFLRRYLFCGTFPSLTAGGRYPPPCPAVPGLSSRSAMGRTSDRPVLSWGLLLYPFLPLPGIAVLELGFNCRLYRGLI